MKPSQVCELQASSVREFCSRAGDHGGAGGTAGLIRSYRIERPPDGSRDRSAFGFWGIHNYAVNRSHVILISAVNTLMLERIHSSPVSDFFIRQTCL